MTTLVTEEDEIIRCQDNLEKVLQYYLKEEEEFSFRFQGRTFRTNVNHNFDIWYASYLIEKADSEPRFWNGIGLYQDLNKNKPNNIAIKIDIATTDSRGVVGAFARNEDDEVTLIHRGLLYPGGYKFLEWYRANFPDAVKTILDGNGKSKDVIIIGTLSDSDFIKQLGSFIRNVMLFKNSAKGNTADF